jgi:CBS domain-containing protein
MPTSSGPLPQSANDLIDTFVKARQTARLRLHLLSLEAQKHWQSVESRLDNIQRRLEHDGDGAVATLGHTLQEINDAIKHVLSEARGSLKARATDLMRPAKTCSPSGTLAEAAQLMWELDCGFAPICDDAGKLVGVVTDRDICMATHLRGQLVSEISISSVMTQALCTVTPDTALSEVMRLMRTHQIKRIPVVRQQQLAGIITLADVSQFLDVAEDSPEAAVALAKTLTAISTPRRDEVAKAAE